MDEGRDLARDAVLRLPATRIGNGKCGEECLRVGMKWMGEYIADRSDFRELSEIHHGHAVGNVADRRDIMGDEEVGQASLPLKLHESVQDLCLDRDVERTRRFVEYDNLGLNDQGASEGNPLPTTAREFVWILVE